MTPWPLEAIWQDVEPILPGFSIELLPQIDSTNSELMRRAAAGRTDAVLLLAERQLAGRGRMGKNWQSRDAQQALTFSLGLPYQPQDWMGLSLALGLSVAHSLDSENQGDAPQIKLKWPNDLWLKQRKLGGILIETTRLMTQPYLVVGMGINISAPPPDGAYRTAPAALCELGSVGAPQALRKIVLPLVQTLLKFAQTGFAPFAPAYHLRDALAGQTIELSDGRCGLACGVDQTGALVLQAQDAAGGFSGETLAISSAEVSVKLQT